MPRKTPLPEREVAICNRLREFREMTQLSRVAFARRAGVDNSLVLRYEFRRVPLHYGPAFKLMLAFGISPSWLATGVPPHVAQYLAMEDPNGNRELQQALFSAVFDRTMAATVAHKARRLGLDLIEKAGVILDDHPGSRWLFTQYLTEMANDATLLVPTKNLNDFLRSVLVHAYRLLRSFPQESQDTIRLRQEQLRGREQAMLLAREVSQREKLRSEQASPNDQKQGLDKLNPKCNIADVTRVLPPSLDNLLRRLKRATEAHGSKTELARELGVTPQRLNGWINGGNTPDGEVTLRLLQWVLQAEAQKPGGPGGADNTTKAKTQTKKLNEKPSSGPPPK